MEKELAKKKENLPIMHEEEAVAPLPEEDKEPAEEGRQSEEDEEREREEIVR